MDSPRTASTQLDNSFETKEIWNLELLLLDNQVQAPKELEKKDIIRRNFEIFYLRVLLIKFEFLIIVLLC